MKIFYPKKIDTEYTANGISCFIEQDGVHYLRRPIEKRFHNGMTWENYGIKWTIVGLSDRDSIISVRGKPELFSGV